MGDLRRMEKIFEERKNREKHGEKIQGKSYFRDRWKKTKKHQRRESIDTYYILREPSRGESLKEKGLWA